VARELGLDPYEIRERNVLEPGDLLPTGQRLDASTSGRACLERAVADTGFRERWRAAEQERRRRQAAGGAGDDGGGPLRGIGLALYFHGAGFTGEGERRMRSPVTVRLAADGRIEVLSAMTDMGQGCVAVFPQIAAAAAGVGTEDLVFAAPDTGEVPDSGPTVASRTTMIVGGVIARAVTELRDRVLGWWEEAGARGAVGGSQDEAPAPVTDDEPASASRFRRAARRYLAEVGPLEVTLRHEPPEWQSFDEGTYRGAAYPTYAWGCDVVEVEVDPDTLEVRPTAVTAVCEVGRAIHPRLCAGQIEGGTLQAVGWALMEEVKTADGRYLNDRLATYIIPTAKDAPPISVTLLENPWEGGPFGAKGVGELPMDGGAPAVAQAIESATGLVPNEIPATPERLMALERRAAAGGLGEAAP
jgi:CO/xanthine dehydrogenase Mo-binding subunit